MDWKILSDILQSPVAVSIILGGIVKTLWDAMQKEREQYRVERAERDARLVQLIDDHKAEQERQRVASQEERRADQTVYRQQLEEQANRYKEETAATGERSKENIRQVMTSHKDQLTIHQAIAEKTATAFQSGIEGVERMVQGMMTQTMNLRMAQSGALNPDPEDGVKSRKSKA